MNLEIISEPLRMELYGFSSTSHTKDYAATAYRLSNRLWETLKANSLKSKGMNIWVYEPDDMVFAGVEFGYTPEHDTGLEQKTIMLTRYAYYKHIGPYNQIKQADLNMQNELKNRGFGISLPYIEIYGHWTNDETKSETELLMSLK
jgi:hypothetical protein